MRFTLNSWSVSTRAIRGCRRRVGPPAWLRRSAIPCPGERHGYSLRVPHASNEPQAEFWNEIAPDWAAAESLSEVVSASFGQAAVDALRLKPGETVLDVGCGTGSTTMAIAQLIGPEGVAIGVDISSAMVEVARAGATAAGKAVEFRVADVQVADLGSGRFDAVFSRFGVMFFADPGAAFTRIRESLRPGGTLSFTCWQDVFSNEWMFIPGAAVVNATGELPPMPGQDEPGPFSLSDVGRIRSLLGDAGFANVEVSPRSEDVVLPAADVDSIVELSRRVGPVREALRDADEELTSRVLEAVRNAVSSKVIGGELRLSSAAHIVTAQA